MRIVNTNPIIPKTDVPDEVMMTMNVSFTANAINYLPCSARLNLDEWIWHEEIIDGERFYIITDKVSELQN